MSVAVEDMRAMSEDELREAWATDEASPALAEARRRDQADKAARERAQLHDEWRNAAHEQFLAAEAECCGNLLSREGLARGPGDPFSLWYGREDVARKYGSWELNDFWDKYPRVTITRYAEQRAAAMRAAREDTSTKEAGHGDRVDANRRPELDGHGPEPVRHGHGTGAGQPLRADSGSREAGDRPATGSVRPAGRVGGEPMGLVSEGVRVARNTSERLSEYEAARLAGGRGGVAVPSQAPVRPPVKPVDGGFILGVADAWMNNYVWMPDAARHTCVLYVAAQHFRLSDENRTLAWPLNFGRVMLLADKPGSGKTTVMTLMGYMAKPWYASNDSNPTARGLGYRIKDQHVMLCIDECHRLFGPKGTRRPDVVTILNSGYERNGSTVDGRGGKANELRTYGAAVMAGKSDIRKSGADELGDLLDRCVAVIDMEKPPEGVELAERDAGTEQDGEDIAKKLAQWAAQEMADTDRFRESFKVGCDAAKEDGLRGRAKDIWAPLLATAWLAGPRFLDAARDAAVEYQLNRPVQREDPEQQEEIADPLADLAARLVDGGEIASWG